MKKYLFLMAMMAISPLALTSCGDDDNDNNSSSSDTVTLPTPVYKNDALKVTLPETQVLFEGKEIKLTRLELTEAGQYLLTFKGEVLTTRAANDEDYLAGNYTKNGDTYTLTGFGRVVKVGNSGTVYNFTVTPFGGEEVQTTGTADTKNEVSSSTMTDNLCRTWTVTNTRLMGTINGKTIGKDFPGSCDLNKIIAYAKENGARIDDTIEDNSIVKSITFSKAGTYFIQFNRSGYDVGIWRWKNVSTGELLYNWEKANMGNPLESGEALVKFENNGCKLTLKAKIDTSGSDVMDLKAVYTLAAN